MSRLGVDLMEGGLGGEPALEIALAQTLLHQIGEGRRPPALRIYRPPATLAFGRRDTFLPGFARAAQAARRRGFTPVIRSAGGRAAAYDEDSLVIDELMAAQDAMTGISERFALDAERQASALRGLGIDARVGEVPGEYCAGEYTVNARGAKKLIGAAQRVIRGGWLFSSVVVVAGSARLRAVLEDVYAALELDWDPQTVGSVAEEAPEAGVAEVRRTLLDAYAERFALQPVAVPGDLLQAARGLLANHLVPGGQEAIGW